MAVKKAVTRSQEFSDSVIDTVREPLIILDQDLRVVTASRSFYEFFKVKPDETEGQLIYNLGNDQWDIPRLRELLETILPQKTTFDNYEVEHDFATIGKRIMLLNARQIKRALGKERIILLAIEDITERKQGEEALRASKEDLQWLFKSMINAFVLFESVFDDNGHFISYRFVYINEAYEHITGVKNDKVKGKTVHEIWPETEPEWIKRYGEVAVTGVTQTFNLYHDPTKKIYHCNVYRPWDTKDRFCVIFEDLTDRKRAEEMMKENEERYKALFDRSLDCVYLHDFAGNFLDANNPALNLLGYRKEEIPSLNIATLLSEDQMPAALQVLQEIEDNGYQKNLTEFRLKAKNGDDVLVQTSGSVILQNGKPFAIQAIARDITERKLAQSQREAMFEALRKSERKFKELFERMSSGVAVYEAVDVGEDFIFRNLNSAGEAIEKINREDIIGKRVTEVFPGIKEFGLFRVLQRVWKTGESEYLPDSLYKDQHDKGTWRESWVYKLPGGEIVAIYNNITERKLAEEALRESEDRFRLLSEAAFEAIAIHDEGVLLHANDQYFKMFGYGPGEALGKEMMSLTIAPESIEFAKKHVSTKSLEPYEMIGLRKDGTRFPIEARVRQMRYKGRDVRFGAIRDITDRKLAEEQIKASLREKDILIREIHHRVKNNMQVISGLLDLPAALSGIQERRKMFHESQSRIHAMSLVHEKLYGSKDFARIDLAGYVKTLSQDLFQTYKIHPEKIDLIIQTDGDVYVDINKAIPCGLILNELISNALKHAFPGDIHGELQIILSGMKNTEIEIVVRDNGLGLPNDVDIQQPLSVGLYLVKGLVMSQLDGKMEVRRNAGTEVRIKFPL